jgi:hypothetical protein
VITEHLVCSLNIAHFIGSSKGVITPAKSCMSTEIAGGTSIASVQETANIFCPVAAGASGTLKDMGFMIVDVLHCRQRLEEYINWHIPALREVIYSSFSIHDRVQMNTKNLLNSDMSSSTSGSSSDCLLSLLSLLSTSMGSNVDCVHVPVILDSSPLLSCYVPASRDLGKCNRER